MAFIRQKNKRDCGVAALAMLCNVTYAEAYRAIPWRREGILNGTCTKQLREGATKLGYRTESTPQDRLRLISPPPDWPKEIDHTIWSLIPDNSLVKMPQLLGEGGWHWVVWGGGHIYDPARGVFTPEEYGDGYPSSYMEFIKVGDDDCPECGHALTTKHSGVSCPACPYWFCY